jgi:hypothetical protein
MEEETLLGLRCADSLAQHIPTCLCVFCVMGRIGFLSVLLRLGVIWPPWVVSVGPSSPRDRFVSHESSSGAIGLDLVRMWWYRVAWLGVLFVMWAFYGRRTRHGIFSTHMQSVFYNQPSI